MELNDFENIIKEYCTNKSVDKIYNVCFSFPKKLVYWGIETSHLAPLSFGDSTRISHFYKNAF